MKDVGPIVVDVVDRRLCLRCKCGRELLLFRGAPQWQVRSLFREFVHVHRGCRPAAALTPAEVAEAEEASCRA